MKKVTLSEISRAKTAVLSFSAAAFGSTRGSLTNPAVLAAIPQLAKHASAEPFLEGRRGTGGDPLDWIAPSIWHASAAILARWIETRVLRDRFESAAATEVFGSHWLYRGQVKPWPIQPGAWRSAGLRQLGDEPLAAYRDFLHEFLPPDPIIGLTNFTPLSEKKGADALAQHYGFPTNLVEFTFNPLVALHFANAPSAAADLPGHPLSGHGVVYQTPFNIADMLATRQRIGLHLPLPPPSVMKRWYQQCGIHIDCGSPLDTASPSEENGGAPGSPLLRTRSTRCTATAMKRGRASREQVR